MNMAEEMRAPGPDSGRAQSDSDRQTGSAPPGAGTSGRERLVHQGLDHLQRAALETIAAMRALLDLAEELVEDPRAAETLVSTIGSLAEAAVRSGADLGNRRAASAATTSEDDDEKGGVQRIPLS